MSYEFFIVQLKQQDEGEHTQIDDIDNNGYLLNAEEDETDPTNAFNQSIRYFILGKTFKNLDVAYDFYNEYGLSKGFGIRKNQVYWHKKTNEIYRRTFVYNKEGFKDMNDKRHLGDNVKRRCITRTGCEAMMQVTLLHGQWVVDKFISEHNHPFDLPSHALKQRSYSIFHRSHECKDVVSLLSNAGMKHSEITKVMNAFRGNEEDNLTRVQCSNIASNKRKYNIGKERYGIIMHFKGRTEIDKEFYFDMDLSKDGTLNDLLGTSLSKGLLLLWVIEEEVGDEFKCRWVVMWRGYGVTRMVYGGRIGEVEVVLGVFLARQDLGPKEGYVAI
ncbi:FAR1-related sequence 5-like protein [Tanacetum coccineum]|uniref:FAR1-related sequence 5-like protein n=1 Tax=Tanacetum coccineum TaxID=301880 RepID=A0ABQ4ZF78_9ASTR